MNRIYVLVLALLLSGCYQYERSEPVIEDGVVVQTVFRPEHTHNYPIPVTHRDANGNTTVTTEIRTEYYGEEHWVVFACQHGQFAVNRKDIWMKVHPGSKVKIKYRQIDTYQTKDKQRLHVDTHFEFESAWPVEAEWNPFTVKVVTHDRN